MLLGTVGFEVLQISPRIIFIHIHIVFLSHSQTQEEDDNLSQIFVHLSSIWSKTHDPILLMLDKEWGHVSLSGYSHFMFGFFTHPSPLLSPPFQIYILCPACHQHIFTFLLNFSLETTYLFPCFSKFISSFLQWQFRNITWCKRSDCKIQMII